ncbi:hypothetical protein AB0M46_38535 [Dactylosporangium sp. NPDC051485]|uniref:hypothetical protein n=1 Tax=Dactylosporangium sp. NPDC051485 TaxID=3154846 RepID=UPI0034120F7A
MTETLGEHIPSGIGALVVAALHSRFSNNLNVEAFAELLAEDARFNMWFVRTMKRNGASVADAWNACALSQLLYEQCEQAWRTYLADAEQAERHRRELHRRLTPMSRQERVAASRERTGRLVDVLIGATDRLRQVRLTGEIGYEDPDMPPVELM